MRKQFLIPEDEIYLNNGTVGSSPAPVLRAVFDGYTSTEKLDETDPEDYPIWGYGPWNEFRDPLAAFVGCTRDEIALLRNATEANSYIANGLDMKPGDEVLMTDQEHPGGEQPWQLKAKRYGIVVKKVTLPKPVQDAPQVLNLFSDAITPRTRVIFFSHITTVTGVVLPAKELCALARSKDILSAVDGAHVTGMMQLDLHDIGCDMYTSSPHKWLQAPKGSGFLYVRNDVMDFLWNTIATAGWDEKQAARRTLSADWIVECAVVVRAACGDPDGECDWHGAHRAAASRAGRLHAGGDDEARRSVVDLARCEAAVRDCDGQRSADRAHEAGRLDVEDEEDPHSRRRAVEAAAVDAVLSAEEGHRSISGCVRRI